MKGDSAPKLQVPGKGKVSTKLVSNVQCLWLDVSGNTVYMLPSIYLYSETPLIPTKKHSQSLPHLWVLAVLLKGAEFETWQLKTHSTFYFFLNLVNSYNTRSSENCMIEFSLKGSCLAVLLFFFLHGLRSFSYITFSKRTDHSRLENTIPKKHTARTASSWFPWLPSIYISLN